MGKVQAVTLQEPNLIALNVGGGRIVKIVATSKEQAILDVVEVRRALKLIEVNESSRRSVMAAFSHLHNRTAFQRANRTPNTAYRQLHFTYRITSPGVCAHDGCDWQPHTPYDGPLNESRCGGRDGPCGVGRCLPGRRHVGHEPLEPRPGSVWADGSSNHDWRGFLQQGRASFQGFASFSRPGKRTVSLLSFCVWV